MKSKVPFRTALVLFAAFAAAGLSEPPRGENTTVPAFPGAEGAGMYTVGGRLGSVYRVTNLNASGPGSLADAVSKPNRIIVFTVSGVIDLSKNGKGGKISVDQPNITIAGQTAPGEGICLKGGVLHVRASEVVVRHLRSRRGFVRVGDMGDAFTVKPDKTDALSKGDGEDAKRFEARKKKKESRGKTIRVPQRIHHIVFDHLSASWATDENLTVTHPNFTTVQYCIAAEGLDYANPNQTPVNHSEGSLWGSSWPDGRSTMHHMLYAHNRLRNPRTTSGASPPPVLHFCNSIVYDWSEFPSHTGSGTEHLNWLNNYYKPGPSTPRDARRRMFLFHGTQKTRIHASGNFMHGFEAGTKDNRLLLGFEKRLSSLSEAERAAMIVDRPFPTLPVHLQTTADAYETVLAEAGAVLPARDPVDLRIVKQVRNGSGKVIQKETDLPLEQRWPTYHSLPAPKDSDGDGIPDYWEDQFGLNKHDAKDAMKIARGGYANIEHYFNNTHPAGGAAPIVHIAASVSRAKGKEQLAGAFQVTRSGSTGAALTLSYTVGGSAAAGKEYERLSGTATIPAGAASGTIAVVPRAT